MTQFVITFMSNLSLTLKYLNHILTTKELHLNFNNLRLHDNSIYLNYNSNVPTSTSSTSNRNLFYSKLTLYNLHVWYFRPLSPLLNRNGRFCAQALSRLGSQAMLWLDTHASPLHIIDSDISYVHHQNRTLRICVVLCWTGQSLAGGSWEISSLPVGMDSLVVRWNLVDISLTILIILIQ